MILDIGAHNGKCINSLNAKDNGIEKQKNQVFRVNLKY
jgi:hypothetical protein